MYDPEQLNLRFIWVAIAFYHQARRLWGPRQIC